MPTPQEPSHGQKSAKGKPPDVVPALPIQAALDNHLAACLGKSQTANQKIDPSVTKSDLLKKAALKKEPLSEEERIVLDTEKRYDQLNSLWKKAEEQVKRFMVSSEVKHIYRTDVDYSDPRSVEEDMAQYHCIAWAKAKGSYRLCYGYFDDRWAMHEPDASYDFTPILDASLEIRKACVPFFSDLRTKVVEAAKESIPELDDSIAQLSQALK